jgi:hypothetical protein
MSTEGYKVWRNPRHPYEHPHYIGELSPADGVVRLSAAYLVELGLPPGSYTIRIPDGICKVHSLGRWDRIDIR